MREQSATNAGKERTDNEGPHLKFCRIDAHRFRSHFVVAYSKETAAIGRVHEIFNAEDRNSRDNKDPGKRRDRQHAEPAGSANIIGAVDLKIEVLNNDADDLVKSQGDNSEIISS